MASVFSHTTGVIEADSLLWLSPGLIDAVRRDNQPNKQQQRTMERVVISGTAAGRSQGAVREVQHGTPALVCGVLVGALARTPRVDDRRAVARCNVGSEMVVLRADRQATGEGKLE